MRGLAVAAAVAGASALSGCGGGGSPYAAFAGFSEVDPGDRIRIEGRGRSATYATEDEGDETRVVSVSEGSGPGDASARFVVGAGGAVETAEAETGGSDVAFDFADGGDRLGPSSGGVVTATSPDVDTVAGFGEVDDVAVFAHPVANGFEYQTFGYWLTGRVGVDDMTDAAAASYGLANSGAEVNALSGQADYAGGLVGLYTDPSGALYATAGMVDVTVDFDADTFSMSGDVDDTQIISGPAAAPDELADAARDALDFATTGVSDTLSGARLGGAVASSDGAMSGDVDGRIYGGASQVAEEVGGTFRLDDAEGVRTHIGAFGGARTD
jgi:hypothetical protein